MNQKSELLIDDYLSDNWSPGNPHCDSQCDALQFGHAQFDGDQTHYLETLFHHYSNDPTSVDHSWQLYFEATMAGQQSHQFCGFAPRNYLSTHLVDQTSKFQHSINAHLLIRLYQVRGHLNAQLDPLGLHNHDIHSELDFQQYDFTAADLSTEIFLDGALGFAAATLDQIVAKLKLIYCQSIGYEFMHIQHLDRKQWLIEQIENEPINQLPDSQISILKSLIAAEEFEQFLAKKFPGAKRFGLEGGESMIPALESIVNHCASNHVQDIVFGMAHRGRLNVLGNVLHKPLYQIFSSFNTNKTTVGDAVQGSGDVKYHLGASTDRIINGQNIHLSLTANPSHLEAVNPIVVGKVRGKQQMLSDEQRAKIVGVLIHGDAAFAGQGIVSEILMLSNLAGYKSGGTLHFIINNQIGFTTSPHLSRSSPYCSDSAKAIQAPIFHVNGDDPEAVVRVTKLALSYRDHFKSDVVIDMICYRRHGHNEIDEPAFTQPLMYKAIKDHPTTRVLYAQKLIDDRVVSLENVTQYTHDYGTRLSSAFDRSSTQTSIEIDCLQGKWSQIKRKCIVSNKVMTAIDDARYKALTGKLLSVPNNFDLHSRLKRLFQEKQTILDSGHNIDWALGESLAFGSLLYDGYPIRLSGQDVGRGTFSQRHAILHDQTTAALYAPLNNLVDHSKPRVKDGPKNNTRNQSTAAQAYIEIVDSPLSEAAVLGFDLGYAMSNPQSLVIWEAQFGDFANGAQVIIDQFLSSSEAKWLRLSGLVMLLPHGYEGQGPEHSSARLERFLQLCAQDNLQVMNCTTPANYFHALRRQMLSVTRKPLIIMTPKSLLRHQLAVSNKQDFITTQSFTPVIDDDRHILKKSQVQRVILCSGKIYYDLVTACTTQNIVDIALIRLEQFYPFPHQELADILQQYLQADLIWCQEEPENMGGWTFVDRRLEAVMRQVNMKLSRPIYVGRPAAASPATGSYDAHAQEQQAVIKEALKNIIEQGN